MKASELRIGNLVKINNDLLPETHGKTYIVYKLQKTFDFDFPSSTGIVSVTDKVNTYTQFDEFIAPIPLTEEWLLRFGFEKKDSDVTRYEKRELMMEYIFGKWYARLCVNYQDSVLVTKVEYVHQLQNLVFALTGEELTLKDMP